MSGVYLSFFECLTYSFAMLSALLGIIAILGYFKISIHWINELYEQASIIKRFDLYYLTMVVYHVLLLLSTLLVIGLNLFEFTSICQKSFNRFFIVSAFIGSGHLFSWFFLFWRVYEERRLA